MVSASSRDPAEVIRALREQVFSISPGEVGMVPGPGHTRVWSVLMEMGYREAVVSLVSMADGTTSLYFSNGGGIIRAGQHQTVRDASLRFIALVDARIDELAFADTHPMPVVGRVRFYARTFEQLRTAEAGEHELGEGRHALSSWFHAGHEVIAAVREANPPAE